MPRDNRLHIEDNWMAVYAAKLRSDLATSPVAKKTSILLVVAMDMLFQLCTRIMQRNNKMNCTCNYVADMSYFLCFLRYKISSVSATKTTRFGAPAGLLSRLRLLADTTLVKPR